MSESVISKFAQEVKAQFVTGHAKEHAYRPALKILMEAFGNAEAVNDPKRSAHGNPDFIFLKKNTPNIILGYAEAKDIAVGLDKTEKTEQLERYSGYSNLFLTNCLEFRFFKNGEKYQTIVIGKIDNNEVEFYPDQFALLADELKAFLEQAPESIKSGKRLAQIMGAKARRIRDNVNIYLNSSDSERNAELEKIYNLIRKLLVSDLSVEKFADMYAQTLVYGLFVARYSDKSPDTFTRSEARDLVPASNPFLREFFDHIVGPRFDIRLAYIVDELCEVFSVSNVNEIVHKHLRVIDEANDDKDPIIHFYEDFLKEYDPQERKRMGAYYTPIPVVKFIIKQVDEILKRDFGLTKGIADTSKRQIETEIFGKKGKVDIHRVQILDPAVGTATFLNEIVKYVHKGFIGQEGRWPAYVENDLLPRLHGFELMMAPYTIAHLKLGMTLIETGIEEFKRRLGIYLTNTLEEGTKQQQDLFGMLGLAEAITEEANQASKIKHDKPIMVIVGNPPYSVSSSNKGEGILNLIKDYKKDLNERKINLDDDYIKFIRFAESLIEKNGEGIVAMITNNSFIDGITHRQMRKHLLETFDDIYILDLHGNSKKKETSPDGSKDENVFDIQQGVSINIFVRKNKSKEDKTSIYYKELFGSRSDKFNILIASQATSESAKWESLRPVKPYYFFVPKDFSLKQEYDQGYVLDDLFRISNSGVKTDRDSLFIDSSKEGLAVRIQKLLTKDYDDKFRRDFRVINSGSYRLIEKITGKVFNDKFFQSIQYRPFDFKWIYYDPDLISRPASKVVSHITSHDNQILITSRQFGAGRHFICFMADEIVEISSQPFAPYTLFPLYLYHEDGTRTPNFNTEVLREFTKNIGEAHTPEDILDYIYAVLHSPKYREKYKEFLKIDFPRVPAPKNVEEFRELVSFGNTLRNLHLMTTPEVENLITTFPMSGSDEVDQVKYLDGKVYINSEQFFGGVPEIAWNFYIGGYQPAQKWLKDRKGRKLSNEDIEHYQKIIKVLVETEKVMGRIDNL